MIKLPPHITGQQPSGRPDDLRTVRPTFVAPAPTDPRATAHALGAHVVRLPRTFQAQASQIDGVPVLLARNGAQVHVLVDSTVGVVEVIGFNAQQVEGIREWLDAAAVAPETELDALLDRIDARTPGRVDIDPTDKHPDTQKALKLVGLSATDDREVTRLLALADTLEDGGASGDAEVTRLAKLGDSLGDG